MKNHNKVQSNKIHIFSIFVTPFYQKNIFIINYLLYRDNKISVNCFFKLEMHSRYVWRTQLHQKCLKFHKITFLRQGDVFNSFRGFETIYKTIYKNLYIAQVRIYLNPVTDQKSCFIKKRAYILETYTIYNTIQMNTYTAQIWNCLNCLTAQRGIHQNYPLQRVLLNIVRRAETQYNTTWKRTYIIQLCSCLN